MGAGLHGVTDFATPPAGSRRRGSSARFSSTRIDRDSWPISARVAFGSFIDRYPKVNLLDQR
jgi:hypothetical protein